jgi:hypothetical protein
VNRGVNQQATGVTDLEASAVEHQVSSREELKEAHDFQTAKDKICDVDMDKCIDTNFDPKENIRCNPTEKHFICYTNTAKVLFNRNKELKENTSVVPHWFRKNYADHPDYPERAYILIAAS